MESKQSLDTIVKAGTIWRNEDADAEYYCYTYIELITKDYNDGIGIFEDGVISSRDDNDDWLPEMMLYTDFFEDDNA